MSKVFRIIRIKSPSSLIKRYQSQIQNNSDNWKIKFKKFMFNWSGFNKYGLYSHDMLDDEEPVIKEALRRQPKELLDGRNFRCIRACQLDFLEIHLPKEEWITYEQDIEYRYLDPFIEEIMAERMEIYKFGCTNYSDIDWPYFEIK